MTRLRKLWLMLPAMSFLFVAGCNRLPDAQPVAEINEPAYEEGKRLLRQGKEQAALAEFFKVIDSRSDGAPESHLEVGLLYQLEIKNPIAAIYHFRRYLELKPNAPQADLVRQRIDAATREFARTLPAQPLENQIMRSDLLDVVEDLKAENLRLKNEIAHLRGNSEAVSTAASRPPVSRMAITSVPETRPAIQVAPEPVPTSRELSAPTRPDATPAPATANQRIHVVVKGDTLSSLSRRYYQTPTRFRDIFSANRDKMRSENDLQIGMRLVIPQ